MIYVLVAMLVSSVLGSRCSNDDEATLRCAGREDTFTVHHSVTAASINCRAKNIYVDDLTAIPNYSHHMLTSFKLQNCLLPDEPLQDYIGALNASGAAEVMLFTVAEIRRVHFYNTGADVITIRYSNVSSDAFAELPSTKLSVFKSNLTLTNTSFQDATNLRELSLRECNLSDLPLGLFTSMPKLRYLYLRDNVITQLSASHFNSLESLEVLDLTNNRLTTVPEVVWQFVPLLKILKISKNPLIDVVSNVFQGSNLTEVHLRYNQKPLTLESLALAEMSHLTVLILEKCNISTVPKDLLRNTNEITDIDLSGNFLRELPDELFAGKNKLEHLKLSNNQLVTVSGALFEPLKNLRQLQLDQNSITVISETSFTTLNNLKTLILDDNFLTSLETPVLALETLSLVRNRFSRVTLSWKDTLTKLKSLNLSDNAFNGLTEDGRVWDFGSSGRQVIEATCLETDLRGLPPTATVTLSNNNISTIPVTNGAVVPKLVLKDVPLRCDCLMHPYARYLHRETAPGVVSDARCNYALLTEIPLTDFVCNLPCPDTCSCLIRPETESVEINCTNPPTNAQYDKMEEFRQNNYKSIVVLDTSVSLKTIPISETPPYVTRLNLTNVSMQSLPPLSRHLRLLDLSNNELTEPPLNLIEEEGPRIWFRNNKVPCDCAHAKVWETMQKHKMNFVDKDHINCDTWPLENVHVPNLCAARNNTILAVAFSLLAVVSLVIAVSLYRHRTSIKVIMYEAFKWRSAWRYDAFVFSAHCDLEFIKNSLLPVLEEDEHLQIGLNQREFTPGDWLPRCIEEVVKQSRRVVIVLSAKSLQSQYELRVLEMALELSVDRGAVVLMLEDIDETKLTKCMRKNIRQAYKLHYKVMGFWRKLISLLREPKYMCV